MVEGGADRRRPSSIVKSNARAVDWGCLRTDSAAPTGCVKRRAIGTACVPTLADLGRPDHDLGRLWRWAVPI